MTAQVRMMSPLKIENLTHDANLLPASKHVAMVAYFYLTIGKNSSHTSTKGNDLIETTAGNFLWRWIQWGTFVHALS